MSNRTSAKLKSIYEKLYGHFGPRRWWPASSRFEVMVGAILTQNTAWPNVEKAIKNLKEKDLLDPKKINDAENRVLRKLIKPSGFYREKCRKLKTFAEFLDRHFRNDINKMSECGLARLRKKLLNLKGIGPETADSILLYALGKPVFVVDAYTKRIFGRHKFMAENASYEKAQEIFMKNLPRKRKLFNEYHALIVETGKNYCKKKKPLCEICPLGVVKHAGNMV